MASIPITSSPPSLTTYMTFWKLWVGAQDTAGTQEGDDRCFSDTGCSQDSLCDMKREPAGRGKRGETVEASAIFFESTRPTFARFSRGAEKLVGGIFHGFPGESASWFQKTKGLGKFEAWAMMYFRWGL